MSLGTAMRTFAARHPDLDEHTLAERFLRVHTKADLESLLEDEFIHLRREGTRLAEIAALTQLGATTKTPRTAGEVRSALDRILDRPYRLGDGRMRRGGEMTADEWRLRRTMLESQRDGIERAIKVCDRALEILETTGAATLRDAAEMDETLPEAA